MANINSGDMNPINLFGFASDAGFSTLGQVDEEPSHPDVLTDGGDLIQNRNYTLIVDRSSNMSIIDPTHQITLQSILEDATLAVATHCEHLDFKGINLYFYNNSFEYCDRITTERIPALFRQHPPSHQPHLAPVLRDAFNRYFQHRRYGETKANGEIIFVLIGTMPLDPDDVKQTIITASKRLYREDELGVLLLQVGTDLELQSFLISLDNELQNLGAKFDICDAVTFDTINRATLSEVLLAAITD
ncbi:hypothetical protein NEA10_09970 [Phormidium yuhuli AB48]|uniref:VWFA domain-containing protein n=1 Tax=Phormidium yuhuli AB48 TaxID=2940671 RepID=A0ABY5AUV5_9CYAN|nr:hypothetical protein [Phormidium yuhuli]USR93015.1 hypothetical protein NEA10_09970 [Phormidium yuhuli AB48]